MKICIPKECAQYPGYYHVPDNDQVGVSPDGKFINIRTGNAIKPGPIYDGYWKISICYKGKTSNWYVHRLLARTFIRPPARHLDKEYSDLEVNHKDRDKSNNTLDNLEWVTPAENINHADGHERFENYPVLCKNITNGAIVKMRNMKDCASNFNLGVKRLSRHLKSKEAGTKTRNWFVFKFDDESPWPVLKEKDYQQDSWDIRFGIWYAKNLETNKIYFHNTLDELCEILNINYASVQRYTRTDGSETTFAGYVIWFDDKPLKDVVDQLPENNKRVPEGIREPKKVMVIKDGIETIYDSLIKASKANDIAATTIAYAITKRNGLTKGIQFSYI